MDRQITFVGAGNMAGALIEALIHRGGFRPAQIRAAETREARIAELETRYGIKATADYAQALTNAAVVLLAVKPQQMQALLPQIASLVPEQALVISVAAGISLTFLQSQLGPDTRVLRAMPNTAAFVGMGATAIARGTNASEADAQMAQQLFENVGICVQVREEQMDAVTALSGSGPAYVFRFTEALIEAAIALGLEPNLASRLAKQTVLGAATLASSSPDSLAKLREQVTSPGGTTEAALQVLEEKNFDELVGAALIAAAARSKQLSNA